MTWHVPQSGFDAALKSWCASSGLLLPPDTVSVADSTGQGRARLLRCANGKKIVVKADRADSEWAKPIPRAVHLLSVVSDCGVVVPETLATGVESEWLFWALAYVEGRPATHVEAPWVCRQAAETLGALVGAADRHLAVDRTTPAWLDLVVFEDEAHWWSHARNVPGTKTILDRCVESMAALSAVGRRSDIVSWDLNLGNLLVGSDNQLCAIIDWDHVSSGDHAVDLVNLVAQMLVAEHAGTNCDAVSFAGSVVNIVGEQRWNTAVIYRVLASLGWAPTVGKELLPGSLEVSEKLVGLLR